jgi:GYF domain 2
MKKYFLHDGTTQYGPFDLAGLETKIITPQTMIWYDPLPNWKPAGEIEELKNLLNNKVPASQILTPPVMLAKQEDWSKKMYYYADNHGQQGPFTLEQLKSRPIQAITPVWYDPLPEWTTADKVPGLIEIISHVQKTHTTTTVLTQKKLYYYLDSAGQKQGPFELEQLKGKLINDATLIWFDPLPEWTAAGKVTELKEIITHELIISTPTVPQEKLYYYIDGAGKQQGPFGVEQMKEKPINAATLIWHDTLPEWRKAGSEESLKDIIANAQVNLVDWSKKLFYYTDATGQQGPFTLEQMRTKYITAATPVWYDPLSQWTTAGQVEGLRSIIR